jgi:beta-lactamase regulating signal transducer with metallopeptidase domain
MNFEAILPGNIEETTGLERDGVITWRVAMDGAPTDLSTVTQSLDIVSNVSRVMSVVVRALLVLWILGVLVLGFVVYNANARRRTPRI